VDKVLDIGCGKRKAEPGAIGIDMSADSAADKIWDLNQYPWPLESDQFTRIYMSHIIEHLADPMRAMAEVYRVARDGANVFVVTPHFSSHNSYVDPTHTRHLAAGSFEYFTGRDFQTFAGAPYRFEIVDLRLTFGGNLVLDNLGRLLATLSLKWYERHAAWMFPALDIRCRLCARK
jgi:SAM-dependent methyltransferase